MNYVKRIIALGVTLFVLGIAMGWIYISQQFERVAWELIKISDNRRSPQSKESLLQFADYERVEVDPYFWTIDFKNLYIRLNWKRLLEEADKVFPSEPKLKEANPPLVELFEKLGWGNEIEIKGNLRLQYNLLTNRTKILVSEVTQLINLTDGRVFELSGKAESWEYEIHHGNRRALLKKDLSEALKGGAYTGISWSGSNGALFLKGSDSPLCKIERGEMSFHMDMFSSPQRFSASISQFMKNADFSGLKQLPGLMWELLALYGVNNSNFEIGMDVQVHESIVNFAKDIQIIDSMEALANTVKIFTATYRMEGKHAGETQAYFADIAVDMAQKSLKVTLDMSADPQEHNKDIQNMSIKILNLVDEYTKTIPALKKRISEQMEGVYMLRALPDQYRIKFDGLCNWQKEFMPDRLDFEFHIKPMTVKGFLAHPYFKGQLQVHDEESLVEIVKTLWEISVGDQQEKSTVGSSHEKSIDEMLNLARDGLHALSKTSLDNPSTQVINYAIHLYTLGIKLNEEPLEVGLIKIEQHIKAQERFLEEMKNPSQEKTRKNPISRSM